MRQSPGTKVLQGTSAHRKWQARRKAGAVDDLEVAGAVQGVKLAARPLRARPQHRAELLCEALAVEPRHLGEAEACAVPPTAVLHRSPEPSVPAHEGPGRTRACGVDE